MMKYLIIGMQDMSKLVVQPTNETRMVAWSGPRTKLWHSYIVALDQLRPKAPADVLFPGHQPVWAGKPFGYSSRRHAIEAAVHLYMEHGQATRMFVRDLEVWPAWVAEGVPMTIDGNPVSVPSQREAYHAKSN